jgi:hypothetical protein
LARPIARALLGNPMSNRSAKHRSSISSNGGFAVGAYNPFEAALRWNSLAFAAYSTIGSEALDFVARRINEDFALVNRLAHCRGHDEVVAAYADFWRKAAEDYGKEAATMGKLVTNAAAKLVVAGQSAMDEDKTPRISLREAAE